MQTQLQKWFCSDTSYSGYASSTLEIISVSCSVVLVMHKVQQFAVCQIRGELFALIHTESSTSSNAWGYLFCAFETAFMLLNHLETS